MKDEEVRKVEVVKAPMEYQQKKEILFFVVLGVCILLLVIFGSQ